MVEIKSEACIGCGACERDCPGAAIRVEDGKAQYVRKCIQCGHCVAVCPTAAVSIPEYEMEAVKEYDKDTFTLPAENILNAVQFRRSIRNYKDKPIEKEKMERILAAGRYTETAKNEQACRFVLVQDRLDEFKKLFWAQIPDVIEALKESNPLYARAFQFFLRKYEKDPADDTFFFNCTSYLVIGAENPLDAGLAAGNIEHMTVAEGGGVLFSGYTQAVIEASPVLKEWLGIEDKLVGACLLMGYPAVTYRRTVPRKTGNIIWK